MVDGISPLWVVPVLSVCLYVISIISLRLGGPKTPLVGLRSIFEPRIVANFRFFKDSAGIINEGYLKAILPFLGI